MARQGCLLAAVVASRVAAFSATAARPKEPAAAESASLRASQALQRDLRFSAVTGASAESPRGMMLLQIVASQQREKVLISPFQHDEGRLDTLGNSTASLLAAAWHRWSPPPTLRRRGFDEFFFSAAIFDWCVFGLFIGAVLAFRVTLLLSSPGHPCYGFLFSLLLAAGYFVAVWTQLGHQIGKDWLAGYVMELTFMVENIFIFSLVINSLRVPPSIIPKALLFVVVGQILFELIFFMGLAAWLRTLPLLPYALGVWLVCCGASCFYEGGHGGDAGTGSLATRAMRSVCGGSTADNRQDFAFTCLVVGALLLADFFLEIDVVLMKIETFPNGYIAFTSSAMAAIALPETFFVGEALLHQFHFLKKGIASILIIFGVQLILCTSINFTVPPLVGCALIAIVLAASIAISAVHTRCSGKAVAA